MSLGCLRSVKETGRKYIRELNLIIIDLIMMLVGYSYFVSILSLNLFSNLHFGSLAFLLGIIFSVDDWHCSGIWRKKDELLCL